MDKAKKEILFRVGDVLLWIAILTVIFLVVSQRLILSLILGIIFGPMVSIIGPIYRRLILRISGGTGKVNHNLEVQVLEDADTAFDVVTGVLHSIPGKLNIISKVNNRYIEANITRIFNWPGNRITINITENNLRHTKIDINSRPVMSTVSLDGGYNLSYVNMFKSSIENKLTTQDVILT